MKVAFIGTHGVGKITQGAIEPRARSPNGPLKPEGL